MKKYIFLITMFVFANNAFAQGSPHVTLPHIGICNWLEEEIDCAEQEITIPIQIAPSYTDNTEGLTEVCRQVINNAGYGDFVYVSNISWSYYIGGFITFIISKNLSINTRMLSIFGNYGCADRIRILQQPCEP
jgi:hypothetical protein